VYAAAVMMEPDRRYRWARAVRDSKVLTAPERERLAEAIRRDTLWSVGMASASEIDRIGIVKATNIAMARALGAVAANPEHLLLDAFRLPCLDVPQTPIIKGDATSVSIAAASIVAKVARDSYMKQMCDRFPGYNFCQNKGYTTRDHLDALLRLGPCKLHRMSWHPINPDAPARKTAGAAREA
jgi:ribonuclease HII